METKQEQEKQEHEERKTRAYSIGDAIRELENDIAYQRLFPRVFDDERVDTITISTGYPSPTININKTQCVRWMREHFRQKPTQVDGKHWEKEGELYVHLHRTRYRIWVSCREDRFRTAQSKAVFTKVDELKKKEFAKLEDQAPPMTDGDE